MKKQRFMFRVVASCLLGCSASDSASDSEPDAVDSTSTQDPETCSEDDCSDSTGCLTDDCVVTSTTSIDSGGSPGTDDGSSTTGGPSGSTGEGGDGSGDETGGTSYECSVYAQDCLEGQKCVPYGEPTQVGFVGWQCVGLPAAVLQADDECTVEGLPNSGRDACDVGLYCRTWTPNDNDGRCASLCSGTAEDPVCSGALACDQSLALTPTCMPRACDPLAQDCPEGQTCTNPGQVYNSFACFEVSPRPAAFRESCLPPPVADESGCLEGLTCVSFPFVEGLCSGFGCCTYFCDLDAEDECPSGTACGSVLGTPSNLGVCQAAPQ